MRGIGVGCAVLGLALALPLGGVAAAQTQYAAAAKPSKETPREARRRSIRDVQRCLTTTGYYNGPISGRMSKSTWTAFWFFKQENGLKAYSDPFKPPVSEKLFALCKAEDERQAALDPAPPPAQLSEAAPAPPSVPEPVSAAEPVDCLFADLAEILRKAQRRKPDVPICATSCLPQPRGLGPAELDLIAAEYAVSWCTSCVALSAPLPLEDILRLERAANVELCATPVQPGAQQTPRKAVSDAHRGLWRGQPQGVGNENAIAVVIGIDDYPDAVVDGVTARADADAMVTLFVEQLGYNQDNVIDLRNAGRADFERVFGPVLQPEGEEASGELMERLNGLKGPAVTVYFSGRGGLAAETGETFLVPAGTPRHRETEQGYPLNLIYERLSALKSEQILVLLETSFSNDASGIVLAPNMPLQEARILPSQPHRNLSVISASTGDQRTLADPIHGLGLFTRYAVEALSGRADIAPVGNGDRAIEIAELYAYTAQFTRRAAARSYGLLQSPVYAAQTGKSVIGAFEGATQ